MSSYLDSLVSKVQSAAPTAVLAPILRRHVIATNQRLHANPAFRQVLERKRSVMTIRAMQKRYAEFTHGDPDVEAFFHPSSIGKCLREMWFKRFKAPSVKKPDRALESHITFEFGTFLHVMFQNLCDEAGILHKREFVMKSSKLRVIGTCDGILKLGSRFVVLEIKSINARHWPSVQMAPKHEHKQQVLLYCHILGIPQAVIVYINKDRSDLKEHAVSVAQNEQFLRTYVLDRVRAFHTAIDTRVAPPPEGTDSHAPPCLYCDFASLCHSKVKTKAWAATAKVQVSYPTEFESRHNVPMLQK